MGIHNGGVETSKEKSMRKSKFVVIGVALALTSAFTWSAFASQPLVEAGPPSTATVRFGKPNTGSPFQPPEFNHDRSFNAVDSIVPNNVVISGPGSVTFDVEGFHQVAVYAVGTTPDDIVINGPFPFVNDPTNRIAIGGLLADTTVNFGSAGKYLVICNIAPHFEDSRMYSWVTVK
jgi:hypothetical protein